MPDIFDKLESFESWFDFSALKERHGYEQILSEERRRSLVSSLHAILKPFLLRRVKADVEHSLPKKREYILYAPLSQIQRELYQAILEGNSRDYLENKAVEHLSRAATPNSIRSGGSLKRKAISGTSTPAKSARTSRDSTPASTNSARGRGRKAKKLKNYEELSDTQYFKKLEKDELDEEADDAEPDSAEEAELERASTLALAKRQISTKKLQNPVLQLRLCCNSPHNFYYPFEESSDPDESLIHEAGKMQLLDRLLPALFTNKHKVLLFSQFKTQLDLIEDYARLLRGWSVCRIDGGVSPADRQDQIRAFNAPVHNNNNRGNSAEKEPQLFLLSTRAGGQGINLAAADTVILFDSDWNPQQDLQAQDRAHRIGQTRPVIVYRLATRGTVEEVLLERADQKRRLEKLVIRKGRFHPKEGEGKPSEEWEELQRVLRKNDGEVWERKGGEGDGTDEKVLLSDEDLNILMDRSDEAFERAEKGLDVGGVGVFKAVETKREGGGLLEGMSG